MKVPVPLGKSLTLKRVLHSALASTVILVAGCGASFLATNLAVETSRNPSVYREPVSFSATVPDGANGTVTFYDGDTQIGIGTQSGDIFTLNESQLSAGLHLITASWHGNDRTFTSSPVIQTVNQAIPPVTWATPASITYGTALGGAQLNASSSVAGALTYSPGAGTMLGAGVHTVQVTFTPADSRDYQTAMASVQIAVNPATPIITWPTPAAITYGTTLGGLQLDASSGGVAGTFTYSPAAGTLLSSGTYSLQAKFVPADVNDYTSAEPATLISMDQASPRIVWPTPAPIDWGTPLSGAQLDASSGGVSGNFSYSPAAGAVLATGIQTLSATFTPTDAVDYKSAAATTTLSVTAPLISINTPSSPILEGTSYAFTATVNGNPGAAVEWAVDGVLRGNSKLGTITPSGVYTAPMTPNESVTITAMLQAGPGFEGSAEIQIAGPSTSSGTIGFAFSLPVAAATSADAYDASGNLVRTIWSNQHYPAGPEIVTWDGNDDYGNSVPAGAYQIRVIYNNVAYTWGVIGDTSASWVSANSWDMQGQLPKDMAIVGSTAYVANGCAEGHPNASWFETSSPQEPQVLFNANFCTVAMLVATDGKLVYYANVPISSLDPAGYIFAYDPSAQEYYDFPSGVNNNDPCWDTGLNSVIDYLPPDNDNGTIDTASNTPTGFAVQAPGNLLAVSHGAAPLYWPTGISSQDLIRLFDKNSGSPAGTIQIPNPQSLAFAPDGGLWVISGSSVLLLSDVGGSNMIVRQLDGLTSPMTVAVDPSTSDVLVADGSTSQQVKRFSESGQLLSTYGDAAGYTDCNPNVTNSRLYLDTAAGPLGYSASWGGMPGEFIAVEGDSSFWVSDPGNVRILHISAQGEYIEQISFLKFFYQVSVDHGNPSRVFADELEYSVNYTEPPVPGDPDPPLGGDGSWKLVRNWTVCTPNNYTFAFDMVQTLPNGHTYGTVTRLSPTWGEELVELPMSGALRFSGQTLMDSNGSSQSITHNGNLAWWDCNVGQWYGMQAGSQEDLVGYDANSWPVWGVPHVLATVPASNANDPVGCSDSGFMELYPEATSSGIIPTFAYLAQTPGLDHHVGGVPVGGTAWTWKASPGGAITLPDEMGTYTDDLSAGGVSVLTEGSSIFEGFNGNYWTFSSQFMQWSEDGLLIGQFGHPADGKAPDGTLFPGAAGNNTSMATATANGNIYLYSSDEGYHSGIHQWTISGLNTVNELTGTAELGGTVILQ